MELLGDIEKTDKTLGDKIREFFRDIVQLLKDTINAYRGVEPDSIEGRLVAQMDDLVTELQQVFAEGIYEAGENFQRTEKNTTVDSGVRYNLRNLTLIRTYVDYADISAIDKVISAKADDLISRGKSVILTRQSVEKYKMSVNWSDKRSVRRLLGDILFPHLGESISVEVNDEFATIYLTRDGIDHSVGGPASEKKAAAFAAFAKLIKTAEYAYSTKNDRHSNNNKKLGGRIDWDIFVSVAIIEGNPYPVTFKIRSIDSDLRSQIYEIATKNETGYSRGDGHEENRMDVQPSYGATPISQHNLSSNRTIVKDNSSIGSAGDPKNKLSARKNLNTSVAELLQQENEKLKEDVHELKELLKLQRTVTGGTKFTKSSVEVAARMLKQSANAKGDTTQLAKLLNSFYEQIATNKELTWETVKELAQPAVDWLQSNVNIKPERSEYAQDILSFLRTSRIYLDESQVAETAYRYGSFNDYRKMMMGSVIIAKDGAVSLDTKWNELATLYPDVFDMETSAADQPEALMNAINMLRNSDTSALEYEYNRKLIAQDLLRQVYDSYWRVSTLYTVADVKQREINQLKAQHYQRMDKLRTIGGIKITKSHLR